MKWVAQKREIAWLRIVISSIEIPDDAILEDWNQSRLQVKSGYLYIPLKKDKGKITGKITGIQTRNALVGVDVTFNRYRKQFELSWSNRGKTFTVTHKNAEKVDLLKWVKEKRRASIMTSNGVCYVSGRLYEQRQPERRNFLSTLKKADIYSKTRSETPKNKSTRQWSRSSVFGVFEHDHVTATALNGNFDVVICDDGSNEYADFICINRAARRLVFVHCKWAKGPRLQIDDVYVVLGQAVKNVDFMWHKPNAKTCQRWRKGRHQTSRFRTILGEFTVDDEAMFTDHNVIREAWVIQPSFNVDQFLNGMRRFSQAKPGMRKLAYLLDQTSITLGDRGVLFRFFGC